MNRPGLRERKKIETLHRMQGEAMRLFEEQGYDETTIEQIAAAAGVSPSTFYRYFPTKEDVVVQDEYDPMIVAAFQDQPEGMAPIEALRTALRVLFGQFTPEDMERVRKRVDIIVSVPAVRARQVQQSVATERLISEMVAERTGRDATDLEVRHFAAVLVASWTAGVIAWSDGGLGEDLMTIMDRCLDHLERGVPL
ncbi:TetR/AcrR family transcriptional regulator [Glycomyces salinus]|uniref:TetR/AcrR family transcriptional regulator n=1 Tax=Glycomyces salinus TaxID=980294 RepID=UPI0018EE43CF|nr:TetR family transcriptional regulator [Glycomyces salinus]